MLPGYKINRVEVVSIPYFISLICLKTVYNVDLINKSKYVSSAERNFVKSRKNREKKFHDFDRPVFFFNRQNVQFYSIIFIVHNFFLLKWRKNN